MQQTVIDLLRQAASRFSQTAYLNEKNDIGWHAVSFAEAFEKSGWFASALLEAGFAFDDKFAILAEGRNDWVITEFGILRIGGIGVPLSIKLLPEEIQFRLEHAGCKGMLVSSNTIEKALESLKTPELKKIQLFYYDDNLEQYRTQLEQAGMDINKVLLIKDLYEKGKEKTHSFEKELAAIEDRISGDQVVTISYTSGTTGNPKGIMLTHMNYFSNSNDAMQFFDVGQGDRLMIILPLDHSFAHTVGIYACLVKGLSIYFVDARGGSKNALKNIPGNLKQANPHFMLTVPALTGNFMNKMKEGVATKGKWIQKLFEAGLRAGIEINGDGYHRPATVAWQKKIVYKIAYQLIFKKLQQIFGNNMRFCVGGGALLDISQQQFFAAIGVPVYQGYGLTEATPIISANNPSVYKFGTSGMVIPNLKCKIVDSNGRQLDTGQKGEIVIKGHNVMQGYYKNPEATSDVIRDEWLYTGDLGYMDEDGFLVVTGREKALLISANGEKYSPEGIEEAIVNTAEYITQVMVYNDMKPFTTAVVVVAEDKIKKLLKGQQIHDKEQILSLISDDLIRFNSHEAYANQFPEMWIPRIFVLASEPFTEQNLMINSTMKMVRHKVLEVYKKPLEAAYINNGSKNLHEHNQATIEKLFRI
ncbi:MAG: AMP-binding protein [Bacteroidales bacterium]|nr:AMP-binding protein [Bacteroidales bacterium]